MVQNNNKKTPILFSWWGCNMVPENRYRTIMLIMFLPLYVFWIQGSIGREWLIFSFSPSLMGYQCGTISTLQDECELIEINVQTLHTVKHGNLRTSKLSYFLIIEWNLKLRFYAHQVFMPYFTIFGLAYVNVNCHWLCRCAMVVTVTCGEKVRVGVNRLSYIKP